MTGVLSSGVKAKDAGTHFNAMLSSALNKHVENKKQAGTRSSLNGGAGQRPSGTEEFSALEERLARLRGDLTASTAPSPLQQESARSTSESITTGTHEACLGDEESTSLSVDRVALSTSPSTASVASPRLGLPRTKHRPSLPGDPQSSLRASGPPSPQALLSRIEARYNSSGRLSMNGSTGLGSHQDIPAMRGAATTAADSSNLSLPAIRSSSRACVEHSTVQCDSPGQSPSLPGSPFASSPIASRGQQCGSAAGTSQLEHPVRYRNSSSGMGSRVGRVSLAGVPAGLHAHIQTAGGAQIHLPPPQHVPRGIADMAGDGAGRSIPTGVSGLPARTARDSTDMHTTDSPKAESNGPKTLIQMVHDRDRDSSHGGSQAKRLALTEQIGQVMPRKSTSGTHSVVGVPCVGRQAPSRRTSLSGAAPSRVTGSGLLVDEHGKIISVRPDRNEASSMQDVLLRASEALNHSYNNAEGVPKSLEEAAAMLPESKVLAFSPAGGSSSSGDYVYVKRKVGPSHGRRA